MVREFAIDLIEQKKELLYIAGVALTEIALAETFSDVNEYPKKKKQKRANVELRIEVIIVEGEPVERVEADLAAMIALSGDWQAIVDCAETLKWKKKSGRLLRTSDIVLSVSGE